MSAREYVESVAGEVIDEIHDLIDLEKEWEESLGDFAYEPSPETLMPVSERISRYSAVINSLSVFLQSIPKEKLDEKNAKKLKLLLESILHDLVSWRNTIFETQEAENIHYLDSSLFSSCLQVEGMFTETTVEDADEDDLELF